MNSLSLYTMADEYRSAAESLADLDIDEQTIADTLEGLSGALEVKSVNVAMVAREMEATAEAIKAAEQKMAERRKALEERAKRVRAYIKQSMELAGISKVEIPECPYFGLAIKNNPESVVIHSGSMIPEKFMRQPEPPPPAPDKTAIKAALKAGEEVPGAHLERTTRLEIK